MARGYGAPGCREPLRSNKRAGTADTKDRGEVRGGAGNLGSKREQGVPDTALAEVPFGLAEAVTHGPLCREELQAKSIKENARASTVFQSFSKKLKDNEILFVDTLSLSKISTKSGSGNQ